MTGVGVAAIVLGLLISVVLSVGLRSALAVFLFVYHLGASFLFWKYTESAPADAIGYYNALPIDFAQTQPGTLFVQWLTSSLRRLLDASYLDMFMIFHVAGFLGMVFLAELCKRMLDPRTGTSEEDAEADHGDEPQPILYYVVLFLPGLHIWTSAIGKDALVFLSILAFMWGVARPQLSMLHIAASLALCALVRPHIAALLAGCCGLTLMFSSGVRVHWRVTLGLGLLASVWLGLPTLQKFLALEDLSASGVMDYVGNRQGHTLEGGSGVEIGNYSFPLKFLTFMYRPLFFDANSALGLVVSFENLVYLGLSALYLPRTWRLLVGSERPFFARFCFVYWMVGACILASSTANLGLAIRQKTMIAPALLLLTLAGYARERAKARAVSLSPAVQT